MMKALTRFSHSVIMLTLAGGVLAACSDFRKAIGREKSSPDEFAVMVRAPLSLPPDFTLRPTGPDSETAAAAPLASEILGDLLGQQRATLTGYDQLFALNKIQPNIRQLVDEETTGIIFERRLPLQMLFGGLPDVGPVLDQIQEDARVRRNRAANLPLTDGATPAFDGVAGAPVSVE